LSRADPVLLKIYAGEQAEHVERMRALVSALPGADPPILEELFRRAHTLKGAARAVGIEETERIVHRMESAFAEFRAAAATPGPAAANVFHRSLDCIEDILAWILGERSQPDWLSVIQALDALSGKPADLPAPLLPASPPEDTPSTAGLVRVDANTLDELIRISAQLVTTSSDPATLRQTEDLAHQVTETLRTYARLRRSCAPLVRRVQADANSSALSECLDYIDSQLSLLAAASTRLERARQQSEWRLRGQVEELHQYAARARMTPASAIWGAFGPMIRELAGEQGKRVTFRNEGLDAHADRVVLESLKDPLLHLLRNAVSHGVETSPQRAAAGKPEAGLILLRAASRGDRFDVWVEDDGAGLDFSALRDEALRRGLGDLGPDDLARLAFTPGVSTAPVSTVSGRGIGLSIVQEAVTKLRGEVALKPRDGGGTAVHIAVPLTIATEHVLLVGEGGETFALPASVVDSVLRKRVEEIGIVDGKESVVIDAEAVPLVRLSELLGLENHVNQGSATHQIVVIRSGAGRAAVAVERVIDDREVIVRETGLSRAYNGMSSGAVALEDGAVAVVLSLAGLVQRFVQSGSAKQSFIPSPERQKKYRILVVDDSITTRSLERSILEAHGFEVELAVDGVEALEKLRSRGADLIISDVSMPRMDGFELLDRLKRSKDTANIPVILVTSLERPEEQERGLSLGADAYIVKRKFDQRELLATVRQIL
jgi:two-component system, chemotaxis family, sensor kinase CheA